MRGRLRADTSQRRAEIVSKHDTQDMDMDAMIDMVFDMETQDPDDFLCLLFLASHPRVRLKAVTLVPGSQEQVGLVRWALERLGVANVAIGAGNIAHEKPSVSPWHWRAFGGSESLRSAEAEEAWRVLQRECDERTVLFTGGPLTNVAEAISRSASAQLRFEAGCWLAQGGFAGDNVVPEECKVKLLAKKGKIVVSLKKHPGEKIYWEELRAKVCLPFRRGGGG